MSDSIAYVCAVFWLNPTGSTRFRYAPRFGARSVEVEIVSKIIQRMSGRASRSEVARLIDLLERDRSGNLAGVLASVEQDEWLFRPEPPRRPS